MFPSFKTGNKNDEDMLKSYTKIKVTLRKCKTFFNQEKKRGNFTIYRNMPLKMWLSWHH